MVWRPKNSFKKDFAFNIQTHTLMCMRIIASTNVPQAIYHAHNLLHTNFIGQVKQTFTYITTPKYAQRYTKLNAPMINKTKAIGKIKPTSLFVLTPRTLTRWRHFRETMNKKHKQTKHKKIAFISSSNYLHERCLTCLKSTNSMTISKLMCKPITSRTGSVTCVSSAHNTNLTTPQRYLLTNPLPWDLQ